MEDNPYESPKVKSAPLTRRNPPLWIVWASIAIAVSASIGWFLLIAAFDDSPDRPNWPYSKYYGIAGFVISVVTLVAIYVGNRIANQPLEAEVLDDDS